MDAKAIVEFLEPMIGRQDKVIRILLRKERTRGNLNNLAWDELEPGEDPAEVIPLLAVALLENGLLQIDTADETMLIDPGEVVAVSLISVAAWNKVKQ